MATIVLMGVGQVIGGPVGGAIGATIGQQIDARIFAPKARHGPRLGALAVQTSSYGSEIPKIFGRMRVAGTVIWATDLRESRSSSGGGKGRPKTVEYSYSASFAVALSGRPIRGVGRIWADGKLLRGAAGDFKSATGFRLYLGGEEQEPDPLIVSVEGVGQTPAYRGVAYALFEDLQLADFGNRIPSLTFEVEAEEETTIGSIAEELSAGDVEADASLPISGYAAGGDSVRSAMESLGAVVPLSLSDSGARMRLSNVGGGALATLGVAEAGARSSGAGGRNSFVREAGVSVPAEVSLAYYDPALDFQAGLQRARRGGRSARGLREALPAAMSADAAKALAEHRLALVWAGRTRAKLYLPWRRSGIRPGMCVRVEGQSGLWQVRRWALEQMVTVLELVGIRSGGLPAGAVSSPGRAIVQPDLLHGATRLVLLDLPFEADSTTGNPVLLVAAAGREAGWRAAPLLASFDGGGTWNASGATAPAAVIGDALNVLEGAGSALIDTRNSLDVEMLGDAMWLESCTDAALAGGANLAAVGGELIQFGLAEPLGPRRFRLSRLLRGRRGTEWAAHQHQPGEPFVLVRAESLARIEAPAAAVGTVALVLPAGLADADTDPTAKLFTGEALRPPAPVHLRVETVGDGAMKISWARRSRLGWSWLSGVDTALGEEGEAYSLVLSGPGFNRTVRLGAPTFTYGVAEQAEDAPGAPLTIEVAQVGSSAVSRPARLVVG
jgi:hypothetical protein